MSSQSSKTEYVIGQLLFKRIEKDDLVKYIMPIEVQAYTHPWSLKIFEGCVEGAYEAWMAKRDNVIVGYGVISVAVGEGHLLNLCTRPEFQGQGIGRKVLGFLVSRVKNLGADTLFLEVRASNNSAIQLYFSEGFNETGIRRGYYPGDKGREDAVLMSLELAVDDYC